MARRPAAERRLIAVEGTRGPDIESAGQLLWRRIRSRKDTGGISRWDASGLFYELRLGKRRHLTLSPRTLVLLYAADLAFRVRWEVRPALERNQVVVVAPYLETVTAFGVAAGLSAEWLASLFRFAPPPDFCARAKEHGGKHPGWKGKLLDGFGEFCSGILTAADSPARPADLRPKMVAYLDRLEKKGGCTRLTKESLGKALG